MTLFQSLAHLTPVSVAAFIASTALVLTRFASTSKPLWDKLPASLQGLLPVLVLVLPQLAEKAMGVHTGVDLADLMILAVVMIAPGFHSHTVALQKPSGPGSGAMVGLVLACALALPVGCATLKAFWLDPATLQCTLPIDAELLQDVLGILKGTGDVSADLQALVTGTVTREAIECVVQEVVGGLQTSPRAASDPQLIRARQRGEAFLASIAKH